jgi:hypothetical protein
MKSITRPPEHALEIFSLPSTERRIGIVSPTSWSVSKSTTFLAFTNSGNERKNGAKPRFNKLESAGLPAYRNLWVYVKPALQG